MTKATVLFPGWRFGPNGECELFQRAEEVPEGWTRTHPANTETGRESSRQAADDEAGPNPDAGAQPDPFDHDGDGKPGGSRPGKRAPRRKVSRRGTGK